jgi:hypothetical protein
LGHLWRLQPAAIGVAAAGRQRSWQSPRCRLT